MHDAWYASSKPTQWLNQFAEKKANLPFNVQTLKWFKLQGTPPVPPHQGRSAPRPCWGLCPVAYGGVKGIRIYPFSKPIFLNHRSAACEVCERRQFSTNVATRVVLTCQSSKIVFRWGSAPDHAGRAYDTPTDPLVGWASPSILGAFGASNSILVGAGALRWQLLLMWGWLWSTGCMNLTK